MPKTALLCAKTDDAISSSDMPRLVEDWLVECQLRNSSDATRAKYETIARNLVWFLTNHKHDECGKRDLQRFFLYLQSGHQDPGGRWGNPQNKRPVRPGTQTTYFTVLRTLFRYLVSEGNLSVSPIESMTRPVARQDQIQPFSHEQLGSLRAAAKRSRHPKRDEAILLLLWDTGLRASELCSLTMADLDWKSQCCTVVGKGNKRRSVPFGKDTARALWQYVRDTQHDRGDSDTILFLSDRGTTSGEGMTRSGLLQLVVRLGEAAGISAVRCSPHTFRHTFAIEFLRNGGNVFALKLILGHTSLAIVNRYLAIAQADIERQHRLYSPVDRMKQRKGYPQTTVNFRLDRSRKHHISTVHCGYPAKIGCTEKQLVWMMS